MKKMLILLGMTFAMAARPTLANVAGGGKGQGPDVTVVDHHDGSVTLANGIVSILIDTTKARLDRVTYTHRNHGNARTSDVLLPSTKGRGQYYYGGFSLGSGAFEYTLATDPATNGGASADVKLLSDSEHNGVMEVHFSMLRGSPGFYSTAIMIHRKQDVKFEVARGASSPASRPPSTGSAPTRPATSSSASGAAAARRSPTRRTRARSCSTVPSRASMPTSSSTGRTTPTFAPGAGAASAKAA